MPEVPDPEELRVGTAERDESAKLLADHYGQGRLSADEYETRVLTAYNAKTRSELRPLFVDLPAPHPACLAAGAAPALPPHSVPNTYVPAGQPVVHQPSPKSKVVAGVLQIVLSFGIGRFYTGHTRLAILQLLATMFFGVGWLWTLIDGIIILARGGTDDQGRPLHD